MERKSFDHTEKYHSGKSWLLQIRMYISLHAEYISQTPFKTFARFHSDASMPHLKALWTLWRPQDPIFIMLQNSCLECSWPISHRALQLTLGLSIDVCNSCFSGNFAKNADKVVWRFVAFWQFRNFESKYPVSSCHPNTLHVGPLAHSAESC